MANFKNVVFGIFLLIVLFAAGTYLFTIIEGLDLLSAFYYVFLSITTIGGPLTPSTLYGKLLTVGIVFMGMGIVLYLAIFLAGAVIEGQTRLLLSGIKGGLVRMRKEKNHIIVCGYGKLGKYVCEVLKEKKQKFLVIEKDTDICTPLISKGEDVLQGDALDHDVLKKAGVIKAKGLIATLKEDSDNLYLIMTATDMNPRLLLGAKADDEQAVDRLHKVGAKIVVLPQVVGGKQLANAMLEVEKAEELETVSKKNNH
jgi:voltage-gated potassium channel